MWRPYVVPYDYNQANLKILCKRYAEASRRTVFFVGAGASAEVGVPTWSELAQKLFRRIDDATPTSAMDSAQLEAFHELEEKLRDRDFWRLFDLSEKHWRQDYEDFLAEEFSIERMETCDIPRTYVKMWKMRNVGQVMTLNIDGLLRRAYDAAFGAKAAKIFEFPGTSVADSRNPFARNFPVLLHLHGVYTSRSTWVMNATERSRLFDGFGRGDYRAFVRHVFENYNVVFVGVNIQDGAISPIIKEISESGLLQDHFWITPSISPESYRWAQSTGVRVVSYTPEIDANGDEVHSPVICSILDDIEAYKSKDEQVVLPGRPQAPSADLPDKDLAIQEAATDRREYAKKMDQLFEAIGASSSFDGKLLISFIREFEVPLELCSIIGTESPYNELEDVRITSKISASKSANVWMGLRKDGTTLCAVKSLSGQALKDEVERLSFRRGIESLYFLSRENKKVAPTYYFHTNVPMAVAMEFVEGANLADHMSASSYDVQGVWLEVAKRIGESLLTCHTSEGGVLHRDLKPNNIIFEKAYVGCDAIDLIEANVRFINFDMSWHKLSSGGTKSISADEVGFYAPEQRNASNSDSPRSAKTDVYMFGMTLLFVLSGISPPDGGAQRENWERFVRSKVNSKLRDELVSQRVTRLILAMTRVDPDERPDLRSIITDLEMIGRAARGDWANVDPDVFIEKILCDLGYDYEWSDDAVGGKVSTPRLIDLTLSFVPKGQLLELTFMRQRDDGSDRKNFGGKLGDLISRINMSLRARGWQTETGGGHHSRSIEARIPIRDLIYEPETSILQIKREVNDLMANIG
ncbi:MAG: protein kinase [Alteromonadaceae bacterium]|nr:protein kinase [Alteromonadaceae bacterium]